MSYDEGNRAEISRDGDWAYREQLLRRWQAIVIQPGDSIHDALWEETQKELGFARDAGTEPLAARIARAGRPWEGREPPHCPTCGCGMAPDQRSPNLRSSTRRKS